jgi:hypothetical protein
MLSFQIITHTQLHRSFHIFNVMRGHVSNKRLQKDGGNFIGELTSSSNGHDHVMTSADGNFEYGAITYRKFGQRRRTVFEGPQPRKCHMLFPVLNIENVPSRVPVRKNIGLE